MFILFFSLKKAVLFFCLLTTYVLVVPLSQHTNDFMKLAVATKSVGTYYVRTTMYYILYVSTFILRVVKQQFYLDMLVIYCRPPRLYTKNLLCKASHTFSTEAITQSARKGLLQTREIDP